MLKRELRRKTRAISPASSRVVTEMLERRTYLASHVYTPSTTSDPSVVGGVYPNVFFLPSQQTSLRSAINQANLQPAGDTVTINLAANARYELTTSPNVGQATTGGTPADPYYGDLDIQHSITINGNGATIDANSLDRIFEINGAFTVTLNNLTIVGGKSAGISAPGGGLSANRATLKLNNVNFTGNNASNAASQGGALYASNANLTIVGGTFSNNRAGTASGINNTTGTSAAGGALFLDANTTTNITNAVFTNNSAYGGDGEAGRRDGYSARGGDISTNTSGILNVTGVSFSGSIADGGRGYAETGSGDGGNGGTASGGSIWLGGTTNFTMKGSTIANSRAQAGFGGASANDAAGDGGIAEGGGIFAVSAARGFKISGSNFNGNTAVAGGGGNGDHRGTDHTGRGGDAYGGGINVKGSFTFTSNVVRNNTARGGAGGYVKFDGGAVGGSAIGGGMFVDAGTITLDKSSFIDNTADAGTGSFVITGSAGVGGSALGGGIFAGSATTRLTVTGSINVRQSATPNFDVTSFIRGNAAYGGNGGSKVPSFTADFDKAGDGGNASGGGLTMYGTTLVLSGIYFRGNGAGGGLGGNGDNRDLDVTAQTNGGYNGAGAGGAVYTLANTTVTNNLFEINVAAGGRVPNGTNAAAFTGGNGGTDPEGFGRNGGNGGNAIGGGIYLFASGTQSLSVTGTNFVRNQVVGAAGGYGGAGGDSDDNNSDDGGGVGGVGGNGGSAFGGGVAVDAFRTATPKLTFTGSIFTANTAMGGIGGYGGRGGYSTGGNGGTGGAGGVGGEGRGGGVYLAGGATAATVTVTDTLLIGNGVSGGDGGHGALGGAGFGKNGVGGPDSPGDGGSGGSGGAAGDAYGGGLYLSNANSTFTRSTLQQNIVSAGWGGSGGAGSIGLKGAGTDGRTAARGGNGTNAGNGYGGGMYVSGGQLTVTLSTIADNEVHAGYGGDGGYGGDAVVQYGGDGGNAGNGGSALGGGIYATGLASRATITSTTIGRNTLEAGSTGRKGGGGTQYVPPPPGTQYASNDEAYKNLTGFSYISNIRFNRRGVTGSAGPLTAPYVDYAGNAFTISSPTAPSFEASAGISDIGYYGSYAAVFPTLAAGVTLGASYAVLTGIVAGATATGAGEAGAVGLAAFGSALAPASGAFLVGAAVAAIGVIVITRFTVAAIETGDIEGAAAIALGSSGYNGRGVNLSILRTAPEGNSSNDETDPDIAEYLENGRSGMSGADGIAQGTGVWAGAVSFGRTVIAANTASRRGEGSSQGTLFPIDKGETVVNIPEAYFPIVTPDVVGTVTSSGTNLVGITSAGFTSSDLRGTTAAPLDPKFAALPAFNGGTTPTLKLLPASPARAAVTNSTATTSQNNYTWAAGTKADIGAYGTKANTAPSPTTVNYAVTSGSSVTFTIADLLSKISDADGDPLSVTSIATPSNGTLTINPIDDPNSNVGGQTIPNTNFDPSGTVTYTPASGFSGNMTVAVAVTDGQFTTPINLSFSVGLPLVTVQKVSFYNKSLAAEQNFTADGTGQRSLISRIVVRSSLVNIPLGRDGTFVLADLTRGSGSLMEVIGVTTDENGVSDVTLAIPPDRLDASGSLRDGRYKLLIRGSNYADTTVNFTRLFGDSDGDGDVDGVDRVNYRKAFAGTFASGTNIFDFDNDGSLKSGSAYDPEDLAAFNARFGTVLA